MSMPVYITDIFRNDIMPAVSSSVNRKTGKTLLQTIKENETAALSTTLIQAVNFQNGHLLELIETMSQYDKGDTEKYLKYPLVYLTQDFTERRGREVGLYAEVRLRIIIAHQTINTYKITDREAKVFKPVLYPIYYELLEQIALHPAILECYADLIEHDKTDRSYWGRISGGGNDSNKLNDYVDAIEIENLKLNFYIKNC